ncbi:MAG: TlpA family protein disulfide reductase [Anaerolineales bacterium]|jgi:thiol-disulfide isomerase/thioredoxin|nr:TlpA family protein disulfide reductase [Anaerolineales bacterium]
MQNAHPSPKKKQVPALVMLGAGLILIGVAAGVILFNWGAEPAGSPDITSGIVPMEVKYFAPDVVLLDLNGVEQFLSDYQGKVVLVNNWAIWCPPCKAEMPTLQSYYEDHRADGFTLIAINAGDAEEDVRQFVGEYGLTFPVWLDPKMIALDRFKNDRLPSSYVIDRWGTVRYTWTGPISDEMLEKYVTPLMEE